MMEEPELEEGEACYKDDASFDPDIAFSYIEDKLQSLLGHHQKDFEGGVSAENLGAKYGGYGSFLPMYQRTPPIRLQTKSPKRVQNPHLSRSPNRIHPEGHAPNPVMASDAPSTRRNESPSPSISVSLKLGSSLDEASVRPKTIPASDEVAEDFLGKLERPTINAVNPTDQKSLKVRIKVGPDRVAQYDAEIYNLGLTSPSSSEGDSHDESDELMLESHVISNESTANILQTIACPVVSGGFLLSPLSEGLLTLPREIKYSAESTHEAVPTTSTISASFSQNDVLRGKQNEVEINKNLTKSQDELAMDLNDGKQKTLTSDNLEHKLHPFHELPSKAISIAVKESVKDAKVKNKKGNKDRVKARAVPGELVKDTSLEQTSEQNFGKSGLVYNLIEQVGKQGANISKKDVSDDLGPCNRAPGNRNRASSLVYSDNSEGEWGKSELPESRYNLIDKVGKHGAKNSKKEVSVDLGQFKQTPAKRNRAPSLGYSDNSEGEGVKGPRDRSSLKVSLNATSTKCNGIGQPDTAKRVSLDGKNKSKGSQTSENSALKADSLRDGGSAVPETKCNGKKEVRKLSLSQKEAVHMRLDHLDNPKQSMERPFSSGKSKDFTLGAAKARSDSADKVKLRSSNERYSDKVTPSMHTVDPPVATIDTTLAEPVLILDNWVGCDRCQKWRLLPYGVQSNQLPDKWVCSMLDWLPRMNRCDISEDETTKAVQALYQVPFPENQHNFQTADGTMAGAISSGARTLDQNPPHHTYNTLMKQKLKEKQNPTSTGDLGPSKGKKLLQRMTMKDESSKKVKQSLGGANATSKDDLQHQNKSAQEVSKSNKRKGLHVIEGEANPRKKLKEKSTQHVQGKVNKTESKHMGVANVVSCGPDAASDLPYKAAKKDGMKKSMQKDAVSGRVGNVELYGAELSTKRIKLKDSVDNQHSVEKGKNNGSNLQGKKAAIKEDSNGTYFHKNKKSRVSQDEEEFKINEGGDITKNKVAEPRIRLSGSKECPITMNIEKEEKASKQRKKMKLTVEDIDKLKKDLGCEQLSTTATSSSSKVSDSRKNKSSYMGVRGSPGESVSSSPARMLYRNEDLMVMDKVGKADPGINDSSRAGSLKKVKDMDENFHVPKFEVSSDKGYDLSQKSNVKSVKNDSSIAKRDPGKLTDRRKNQPTQREHDKDKKKLIHPCSAGVKQESLNEEFLRSSSDQISRKLRADSFQGDEQDALYSSKHGSRSLGPSKISLDGSIVGDISKALKGTTIGRVQNGAGNCINNEAERSVVLDANAGNRNIFGATAHSTLKEAEDVWREAEELRSHADLIKNSGFSSESNDEYFKAALKFLTGASLFEACNGESIKHLEMSPMQMYSAAAKLFRACASDYDKGREVAAAVLAYKCTEVAYLRVVYCKSSSTNRLLQDLQSSLQMIVPQGESPSSSASDVDNLNNLAAADKATLAKGSSSLTVNHIVLPRNRHNLIRLLDFTKDSNSAMEAAKKSQETFSAALVELEESQNTEGIIALKRVVEFSFQNVEELIRLVLLAFNTINHGIARV